MVEPVIRTGVARLLSCAASPFRGRSVNLVYNHWAVREDSCVTDSYSSASEECVSRRPPTLGDRPGTTARLYLVIGFFCCKSLAARVDRPDYRSVALFRHVLD